MKQPRLQSLVESLTNIAVGFGLSMLCQATVLPVLGVDIPLRANFVFAAFMTVISVARQFSLRRLFEALHMRRPISPAMAAVIAERFRQIEVEGWTPEHDRKTHDAGELAYAGAHYAFYAGKEVEMPSTWTWKREWWKPQSFRRDLVRAAALIIADIEMWDAGRKRKS